MVRVANKYHGAVAGSVYIGRGSIWGNPYSHMKGTTAQYACETREESVKAYAEWIVGQGNLMSRLGELEGKTLMCFCRPVKGFQGRLLCHGQVLAGLVDKVAPESVE